MREEFLDLEFLIENFGFEHRNPQETKVGTFHGELGQCGGTLETTLCTERLPSLSLKKYILLTLKYLSKVTILIYLCRSFCSETHADLQSWLGEIEAEIQSLEIPTDASPEQIRKQKDNAQVSILRSLLRVRVWS